MAMCRVSEIWHAWGPLACKITKTHYVSKPAPTHEKRTGKMPGSCLPINYLICLTLLTGKSSGKGILKLDEG